MQYTQNLNLPLFEAGDAVDLLTSYNVAMRALDAAVAGKASATEVQTALDNAASALQTATAASTTAGQARDLATAASAATTRITPARAVTTADLASAVLTEAGLFATAQVPAAKD